jgi:NAD(P)-dependent dehydrogenase (short-subunit alcohol dehydrogenase family)
MDMRMDGKAVLVTGGTRGIGRAVAQAMLEAGAHVALTARDAGELERAGKELDGLGGEVFAFAGNVADPEHAEAAVAGVVARHGRLDVLVNNAATSPYFGPMHRVDTRRLDKSWEVNVRGPLLWTQQAWRQSMGEHGGAVVNVASIGALLAGGPTGVYNMTKAALVYQTRQLATEFGPRARVNAVAPGVVKTSMSEAIWSGRGEHGDYPWPLRRLGRPEDVAAAVLYLASDLASWVTGHVLVVDGGALCAAAPDVMPE